MFSSQSLILAPALLITASQYPFTTSITLTCPTHGHMRAFRDQDPALLDRKIVGSLQGVTARSDSSRPPVPLAKLARLLVPPEAMQLIVAGSGTNAPAGPIAAALRAAPPKPAEAGRTVLRFSLLGRRSVGAHEANQPRNVAPHEGLQHREAVAEDTDVDLHRRPDRRRTLCVEHIWVVDHGANISDADAGGYDRSMCGGYPR